MLWPYLPPSTHASTDTQLWVWRNTPPHAAEHVKRARGACVRGCASSGRAILGARLSVLSTSVFSAGVTREVHDDLPVLLERLTEVPRCGVHTDKPSGIFHGNATLFVPGCTAPGSPCGAERLTV